MRTLAATACGVAVAVAAAALAYVAVALLRRRPSSRDVIDLAERRRRQR